MDNTDIIAEEKHTNIIKQLTGFKELMNGSSSNKLVNLPVHTMAWFQANCLHTWHL